MADLKDLTLQQKIDNQARINGIFKPSVSNDAPPKAVNAFSDGVAPETVGSGQQVGNTGYSRIKYDAFNGKIEMYDTNNNVVILLDSNG